MTQHEILIVHFDSGKSLTVAEALSRYGIYALSQRVGDLKRKGIDIQVEMVEANGKRFARYYKKISGELF